ncbi:MAG: methyltransferase domain-containing protein [Anaerolineae bacterium]|nr:MAG: methyltransferase domain-containing protein [Anaerolineae bacterium]
MDNFDRGQVSDKAAEVYEDFFVPALFQEWAGRVADAAHIQKGQHVLDVACGTGILARTIAERLGEGGSIVGLDINNGMLAVATHKAPSIDWRHGTAEALPFDNDSFDVVVSQFGLMFFENRPLALQEMVRVLRTRGHFAIAVWDSLDHTPGYFTLVNLLQRLFGEEVANSLRAPFVLGEPPVLRKLFGEAGILEATITTMRGTAHFPSIQSWVYTDVKGWVLADMLNDRQFELLLREAEQALSPYVTPEGEVVFDAPAHIISGVKK